MNGRCEVVAKCLSGVVSSFRCGNFGLDLDLNRTPTRMTAISPENRDKTKLKKKKKSVKQDFGLNLDFDKFPCRYENSIIFYGGSKVTEIGFSYKFR